MRSEAELTAMIERLERARQNVAPAFKSTHASIRRAQAALAWALSQDSASFDLFLHSLEAK